jgi:hypothetical protein
MVYTKGKFDINTNEKMLEIYARPIRDKKTVHEIFFFISCNPSLIAPDKDDKIFQIKLESKFN